MSEEEYAIVSKKEFMKLKQELEKIKKNPLEGSPSGANLQESIDNLNTSLTGMMNLFKEASDELKIEERDTQVVSKKLDPMMAHMETLIEQNQKIAKGIIAVADMVKEKLEEIEEKTTAKPEHKEEKKLPPLGEAPVPPMPKPAPEPAMPPPGMAPPMPENNPPGGMPPPRAAPEGFPPPMPNPGMMPPGPGAPPPGFDMPGPMGPPPGERARKKPILGGFLTK